MILRNHGLLVVGGSIPATFYDIFKLDKLDPSYRD